MMPLFRQPALDVDRGHAAGAGGSDGLAIVAVGHVAGGEHAVDARVGAEGTVSTTYPLASTLSWPPRKSVFGVWPIARKTPPASTWMEPPSVVLLSLAPV